MSTNNTGSTNWAATTKPSFGKKDKSSNPGIKDKKRCFKQQKFDIECKGLKPNTVHKFYYEGVDRGEDCIPRKPKPSGSGQIRPGATLITDEKGRIDFDFYFTIDVEKQVDAENKVKYELAGDKKFELRAENSSAFVVIPFKDHHKHHHK